MRSVPFLQEKSTKIKHENCNVFARRLRTSHNLPNMRSTSLESLLFLFTLKSFVVIGYPINNLDKEDFLEDNSVVARISTSTDNVVASITPYACVYIPPELDFCNFISYHKSKENFHLELSEKKKHKLLNGNKRYSLKSSLHFRTEKFRKQKPARTIIYEIQTCVPPRLPFIMPWCTDEDLSDKKSETRRLYPFVINGSPIATYEFPVYDFSRRTQTVARSI